MSTSFNVSPQQLAANSGHLDEIAQDIKKIVDRHVDALAAIGKPWGDDDLGHSFAGSYQPAADDLTKYITAVQAGVAKSVDAVVTTAMVVHLTENSNSEVPRLRK